MSSNNTTAIAVTAVATAGVAALLYYLLKEEKPSSSVATAQTKGASAVQTQAAKITRNELLEILGNIAKSQEEMKTIMAGLMEDVMKMKPEFGEMYDLVKKKTPDDPLEKAGITMQEFDTMLDANQDDPEIRKAIMTLMGGEGAQPNVSQEVSQKVLGLTVAKIRDIHVFMLEELRSLLPQAQKVSKPDGKTIAITAQALVGAKVQAKFELSADEVESAVRHHHASLACDQDFATLALQVQQIMSRLMNSGQWGDAETCVSATFFHQALHTIMGNGLQIKGHGLQGWV